MKKYITLGLVILISLIVGIFLGGLLFMDSSDELVDLRTEEPSMRAIYGLDPYAYIETPATQKEKNFIIARSVLFSILHSLTVQEALVEKSTDPDTQELSKKIEDQLTQLKDEAIEVIKKINRE